MAVSMLSHWSTQQVNCLRLALGVTFSLVIALLLAWPGSFLMAIITSMLLSSGAPPLSIKQGLGVMLATFGLLTFGQLFTEFTLDIPIVCTLFIVLFIILGQYAALSGTSTLLVIIWFISILVLPLLGMASPDLVAGIAGGLFTSISLAVVCSWLAFTMLPFCGEPPSKKDKGDLLPENKRLIKAIQLTLLILPVFLLFYLLELTGDVLILVFVVLLIQMPSTEMGIKSGVGLLLANAFGGLAAIVIYKILTITPSAIMLALLIFIAALLFGQRIFSSRPMASLYGSGLNTIIVILGSTTGSFGDGAAETIWIRLCQIFLAVIYIVAALSLLEGFRERRAKSLAV